MRTLYLIRHAPVRVDPEIPPEEWPIDAARLSLVEDLLPARAKAGLRRIVTSQSAKAIATGAVLARALGVPIYARPGLEEHHRRPEDFEPDQRAFESCIARLIAEPDTLVFGSETANAALSRFETSLASIMSESDGDEAIVTHGTVISLLLAKHGNGDALEIWRRLDQPHLLELRWPTLQLIQDLQASRAI